MPLTCLHMEAFLRFGSMYHAFLWGFFFTWHVRLFCNLASEHPPSPTTPVQYLYQQGDVHKGKCLQFVTGNKSPRLEGQ